MYIMYRRLLTYIFFIFACLSSLGQVNQVLWSNGKTLYANPVAGIDSITYGQMVNADTFLLILDRQSLLIINDTTEQASANVVFSDTIYVTDTIYIQPEYVDLGLSVKWATFNIGAAAPEEKGYHIAWGETERKDKYSWATYAWSQGNYDSLTKYCTNSNYGTVDDKSLLEANDDAAVKHWGGKWRTPTHEEWSELIDGCTWSWITLNGMNGYKVTGKKEGFTNNSIFLPAAGYRSSSTHYNYTTHAYYQSSSLYTGDPNESWRMYFHSTGKSVGHTGNRYTGYSVRPVYGKITQKAPTVTTIAATQVKDQSALVGGKVTSNGYAKITEYGVVYSTSPNPTTSDNKLLIENGIGLFVDMLEGLPSHTTYYYRAFATNQHGTSYGAEESFTTSSYNIVETSGSENGYAYVDLGLSVMWATMNVGATAPEESGHYYAWGETEPKASYSWKTYKWCNGTSDVMTKYNTDPEKGSVDNITTLEAADDAATVNWGGQWRTPTRVEWTELRDSCIWVSTIVNGVKGNRITSKINGNSIFLPAAGYMSGKTLSSVGYTGYCRSSSLYPYYATQSHEHIFRSSYSSTHGASRYLGEPVRPVWGNRLIKLPTVTTVVATQITESSAIVGGKVSNDGGGKIIEHGVVYNTKKSPTIANNKVVNHDGLKSYTCQLTGLEPDMLYYARAYATNEAGTKYGSQIRFTTINANVSEPTGKEEGHGYVDLGLSVKWATCNIGADLPSQPGDYYAWGETSTKDEYLWGTYRWCNSVDTTLTKYCVNAKYGVVDNRVTLEAQDDASAVNWGGKWRTPSDAEWTELRTECTWYWVKKDDINGYKIVAKNGNSIFLPAAGYRYGNQLLDKSNIGNYWSSSLYLNLPEYTLGLFFSASQIYSYYNGRCSGQTIRPVCP